MLLIVLWRNGQLAAPTPCTNICITGADADMHKRAFYFADLEIYISCQFERQLSFWETNNEPHEWVTRKHSDINILLP